MKAQLLRVPIVLALLTTLYAADAAHFGRPTASAQELQQQLSATVELTAAYGSADDWLGRGVAISSDGATIVAGAPLKNVGANYDQGAAYVYTRVGSHWSTGTETARLIASDGVSYSHFGNSVAIGEDLVVVGAYGEESALAGQVEGAVYLFAKPAGGWGGTLTETASLNPSAPNWKYDFSTAVSITADGGTVFCGSPGKPAVYVFPKPADGWGGSLTEATQLTPADTSDPGSFGIALAVTSQGLAVGASFGNGGLGIAYVFTRPAGGWDGSVHESDSLVAADGASGDLFGGRLAVGADMLVVGAAGHQVGVNDGQGAVYLVDDGGGGDGPDLQWHVYVPLTVRS